MEELSPKKRVFVALKGGKVDRPPVTSIGGCEGTLIVDVQKATGIYLPEAHKDPEKMAKLAIASQELTGLENVRVPFDFVVEPEALGCEIKWPDKIDQELTILTHVYKTPDDLDWLENLLERGRIPVVLEAIRIIKKEVGDSLPIASIAAGPFTLGGGLVGASNFLVWTLKNPYHVEKFVDFSTDIVLEYAKAQYSAGSDIVGICEPNASCDMIDPRMFKIYVKPALMRIAEELKGLRVLHVCGKVGPIIEDMAECGFDGISIEEPLNIGKIKPMVGGVKILGNIQSKNLALNTPDAVKEETKKALEAGVDLLEAGEGILLPTPLDNIKAMVETVKEWKTSSLSL
ncbi:MAG: MtaA/CmuA family methyltransferase [archaeon]|nr:MtaA/CmuA family methyltransferase [archaeon]